MYEELLEEIEEFYKDVNDNDFKFGRYIIEDDYEDECSHNEIYEYQNIFIDKAREYLHQHFPNKFIISRNYCVMVMTVTEAKSKGIINYEKMIVR